MMCMLIKYIVFSVSYPLARLGKEKGQRRRQNQKKKNTNLLDLVNFTT